MPRPIHAVIHQSHLKHNLAVAKASTPHAAVYAVVKANAYGHGIQHVYPALNGADGFALLDLEEAILIRSLGWDGPILLLEGIFHLEDLIACHHYQLHFVIHNDLQIQWLESNTTQNAQYQVYLKMNSGMNRLGFKPEDYKKAWNRLNKLKNVNSITHMTHFSDADRHKNDLLGISKQLNRFEECTSNLPGLKALSNSAAILGYKHIQSDIVRSGIMLYGSSPSYPLHDFKYWNLKPAMSLRSEVIAIQELTAGDHIGYGSTFTATQSMTIAVVACGYADGYQRMTKTGTPVLINGQRAPIVGRVSMDMLTVDISHLTDPKIGDEVVLWGYSSCGEILSIDEVAAGSQTLGYELMCSITQRVKVISQTH